MSTWLVPDSPAGALAVLLIGHAPARRTGETAETIETGLLGIADALGLQPPSEPLPDTGARLTRGRALVTFDYGHPAYSLHLPPTGPEWRAHLADGGPACVLIGLDPVPPGASPDAMDDYLSRIIATGRVRMGVTRLRKHPHHAS
ncbi:hypothetical protein [Streptomyces axinellae]|uniref:hypothetical protein n=1 Tax=Streptomyces axinellae TaxID=552788 RepID=UPI0031D8AE8B